jgi:hypothetical protein
MTSFLVFVVEGRLRPAYKCDEARRLLNLIWTARWKSERFLVQVRGEIVKTRTQAFPRLVKTEVDVPRVLAYLRSAPIPTDYLDIRDVCILLYLLSSGRRPSNAAAAKVPEEKFIFGERAILFRELGAKNDAACVGNFLLIDAASDPLVDPISWFHRLFAHPEFVSCRDAFRSQNPTLGADLTPLFMYRVKRGAHAGRVLGLRADTCSNIVAGFFNLAGANTDASGTRVHPKFIRRTQFSRMRVRGVPDVVVKFTGAWKVHDVSERHYFSEDGRPLGLTDLLFHLSDALPATMSWLSPSTLASQAIGLQPLGPHGTISGRSDQ